MKLLITKLSRAMSQGDVYFSFLLLKQGTLRYDKLFLQFSQTVSPIAVLWLIATLFTTHFWRHLNSIHQYRGRSRKRTTFSCNILNTSWAEVNVDTYPEIKWHYSVKSHGRTTFGERRHLSAQCKRRTSVLNRKSNKYRGAWETNCRCSSVKMSGLLGIFWLPSDEPD